MRSRTASRLPRRSRRAPSLRAPRRSPARSASPRPNPPVCRLRPGSDRANRSKIRSRSAAAIPVPVSRIQITASVPRRSTPNLDRVRLIGMLHRVLDHGVERDREPVGVARAPTTSSVEHRTHRRGVAAHRWTASTTSWSTPTGTAVRHLEILRARQEQETVGEPAQPHQLVGDHRGVLRDGGIGRLPLDQLGVAERHRDRRAELVGGVLDEAALALEETNVVQRDAFRFLGGRQSTPRVPHHRREHGGHERHLGELVERLTPTSSTSR